MRILILNGPNLNLTGQREQNIYGDISMEDINKQCYAQAKNHGINLDIFQSNYEGALVDKIHSAKNNFDYIIINAGAYTHTSIAILDALLAINIPIYEIHLSNPLSREAFRHKSYISKIALGTVQGLGYKGYLLLIDFIASLT